MNFLPPIKIAQGEAFAYSATVVGQNYTGYAGVAVFKTRPQSRVYQDRTQLGTSERSEPIVSANATGDAAGGITFALVGAETAKLPAQPRIGYFQTCVCEITMSSGADVQRFQMPVSIAGAV